VVEWLAGVWVRSPVHVAQLDIHAVVLGQKAVASGQSLALIIKQVSEAVVVWATGFFFLCLQLSQLETHCPK